MSAGPRAVSHRRRPFSMSPLGLNCMKHPEDSLTDLPQLVTCRDCLDSQDELQHHLRDRNTPVFRPGWRKKFR
jgi:hypothetical protein